MMSFWSIRGLPGLGFQGRNRRGPSLFRARGGNPASGQDPEGEVDPAAPRDEVAAPLAHPVDAVEGKAGGATEDADVAGAEPERLGRAAALRASHAEEGVVAQGDGDDGLGQVGLVAVLVKA